MELRWATPRSPSHLAHPSPSPPQPSRALPLTSGPSRQGERQQAEPGSAHAPGHGGSGHSRARLYKHTAMPASQPGGNASGTHCSPSASQPGSQPSAATLRPQLRRAPPQGGGGDTAERGREGPPGVEPEGPLGSQAGSGDPDPGPRRAERGRARPGEGLGPGFPEPSQTPLSTAASCLRPALCWMPWVTLRGLSPSTFPRDRHSWRRALKELTEPPGTKN